MTGPERIILVRGWPVRLPGYPKTMAEVVARQGAALARTGEG